jgi:transitional endoplasmic reticulum ATPase
MPLDKSVDINRLADETEGYTGADLESLSREAAIIALRESMEAKSVTKKTF